MFFFPFPPRGSSKKQAKKSNLFRGGPLLSGELFDDGFGRVVIFYAANLFLFVQNQKLSEISTKDQYFGWVFNDFFQKKALYESRKKGGNRSIL